MMGERTEETEETEELRNAASTPQRRPMRVLLVTPRYFPFMGGIETHVHEVAQRLAATGVDVTVLTTDPSGKLPAREEVAQVTIRRVRAWPAQQRLLLRPGHRPCHRAGTLGPHSLPGHPYPRPATGYARGGARQIPFVLTFHTGGHSSRMRNAVRSLQWMTLRPLLARARALIGVSTFEADFFRRTLRLPADRFVVIRNGGQLPSLDETYDVHVHTTRRRRANRAAVPPASRGPIR